MNSQEWLQREQSVLGEPQHRGAGGGGGRAEGGEPEAARAEAASSAALQRGVALL